MIVSRGGRDDGWNKKSRLNKESLGRSFAERHAKTLRRIKGRRKRTRRRLEQEVDVILRIAWQVPSVRDMTSEKREKGKGKCGKYEDLLVVLRA